MTVYNITKVVNKTLIKSIKEYLDVDKVTIFYSDFCNKFGVRVTNNINKDKVHLVSEFLWSKLSKKPITMFTSCSKIDIHNASLIRKYGRNYTK